MAEPHTVYKLAEKLKLRAQPAITRWNRLEGRPRTLDFDRALGAEVRDPLWMLTRQWQMGEFRGDDAGSPVMARICTQSTMLDSYRAGSAAAVPFPTELPLEATVERRPLAWTAGSQKLALDLRLALGRRWRQLLDAARARGDLAADHWPAYLHLARYRFDAPDPGQRADAAICAHPEAWRQFGAAAGRAMDGYELLAYLDGAAGRRAADDIVATSGDADALDDLAGQLRNWLARLVEQPAATGNDAWLPSRLEYQFGCTAPLPQGELVLSANEYYQGHLDWYSLDRERAPESLRSGAVAAPVAATFIPAGVFFAGMPNTRWWTFEESRTNFGAVKPDTTDLGKLLLLEFGIVYANDWFVFPLTLPVGSATTVHGIALTNVFGERIWIEPARTQLGADAQRWELFQSTRPSDSEPMLMLVPATAKTLESEPVEEIALVRDEMANMVWGVERRIPLPSGRGKAGGEAASEFRRQLERIIGPPPVPPAPLAPIRYEVMNSVTENWIPFVPVHLEGSSREIRLQRGAMPRTLGPDPSAFERVRPRTALLREGLDPKPGDPLGTRRRYFIEEEEVPRAGAVVTQAFQRTRWMGGRPVLWLGAAKSTGRGEGASGLAFDLLACREVKST